MTTDAAGDASIAAILSAVPANNVITATATDLTSFDTSELSNAVAAVLASAIPALSMTSLLLLATILGIAAAMLIRSGGCA